MITEILILLFGAVITTLSSLLPAPSSLPPQIASSLAVFTGYFAKIQVFFPLDVAFQVVALILAFEGSILLFKFFNFALNKLRGSG